MDIGKTIEMIVHELAAGDEQWIDDLPYSLRDSLLSQRQVYWLDRRKDLQAERDALMRRLESIERQSQTKHKIKR